MLVLPSHYRASTVVPFRRTSMRPAMAALSPRGGQ